MLACCSPASGRARIEFSICTMAGPGRPGVGVGVVGPALDPQAASSSASPQASVDPSRLRFLKDGTSIRKGDSVAHGILWYVHSDVAARNAPDADPGRALPSQPSHGMVGPFPGAYGRRGLPLGSGPGAQRPMDPLFAGGTRPDLWDPGGSE